MPGYTQLLPPGIFLPASLWWKKGIPLAGSRPVQVQAWRGEIHFSKTGQTNGMLQELFSPHGWEREFR